MLIEADKDPRYHRVTFTWTDPDPATPARDVLVRLITLADRARADDDLTPYLLRPDGTGQWRTTLRLRSDFRSAYQFCVSRDRPLGRRPFPDEEEWLELLATGVADPANPHTFGAVYGNPGPSSVLELPAAPPQPWVRPRPQSPAGAVAEHSFTSAILGNTRRVWLYTPPGHREPGDLPVAVLLDGDDWAAMGAEHTFDNLIADQAIPPTAAVLVDAGDTATRNADLTSHDRFLRFLTEELMPWAHTRLPVTTDPARTLIAGQSYGGLMAAYAGLHAPDRFGLILTQSGSFWWPRGSEFDIDAGGIIREYAAAPRSAARFYQEAGLIEWLLRDQNRHLRDVLRAKGYDVTYREYHGGHDYACWRGGMADGLRSLLGGTAARTDPR